MELSIKTMMIMVLGVIAFLILVMIFMSGQTQSSGILMLSSASITSLLPANINAVTQIFPRFFEKLCDLTCFSLCRFIKSTFESYP